MDGLVLWNVEKYVSQNALHKNSLKTWSFQGVLYKDCVDK
jgi:hypothetical protein